MVLFNVIPNPYSLCAAAKTETWLSYEDVDQNRIEQNKTKSQKCLMNMMIQQNKNKQ